MGRDYTYYRATCGNCGNSGRITVEEDDWLRWKVTEFENFRGCVRITGLKASDLVCEKCGASNTANIEHSVEAFLDDSDDDL